MVANGTIPAGLPGTDQRGPGDGSAAKATASRTSLQHRRNEDTTTRYDEQHTSCCNQAIIDVQTGRPLGEPTLSGGTLLRVCAAYGLWLTLYICSWPHFAQTNISTSKSNVASSGTMHLSCSSPLQCSQWSEGGGSTSLRMCFPSARHASARERGRLKGSRSVTSSESRARLTGVSAWEIVRSRWLGVQRH